MMQRENRPWKSTLCFLILIGLFAKDSYSVIDDVFRESDRRQLVKAPIPCPINFEFLNYTVITGYCKGPKYPPKACCKAFKNFACPFAKELNDPTNDCASTMFSYINLYGKYPPGLFASVCRDNKKGLKCP